MREVLANPGPQVYRWRVDEIQDVYGNTIEFEYYEYKHVWDYASYLKQIRYNKGSGDDWATEIVFDGSTGIYIPPSLPVIFQTCRQLDGVRVTHLDQVIREYRFDYHVKESWGATIRTLIEIEPYGLGGWQSGRGQSLPATEFKYIDKDNVK